ncbi:hypothetical protein O3M35_009390 [Rhynocoris fuscipes]|uniref:Cytochrome b561 domain-containing protein n=1 Tax=Rhynocoris fuscipes TaxID=488301 RepID=A0AAW1D8P1_9HEMI
MFTAITIFRALRYISKIHVKRLHAAIHLLAIGFGIGGLVTAFDMFNSFNGPHLRSLHGLFGIITVIFFCIQV